MPIVRLTNFGGMIPAVDSRLLPDNQAQLAENTWVYSGAIEGFREPVSVRTLANPAARRAYRIPVQFYDKGRIPGSYWLEFENPDVDVLGSPVADDSFERFYWASSQSSGGGVPQYNTKARIAAGSPPFKLGIPRPATAPTVTRTAGQYVMVALGGQVEVTGGGNTRLYNTKAYAQDVGSLYSGGVPEPFVAKYRINGSPAEMRYTTVNAGLRITVSDTGQVTVGVPSQPDPATSTPEYTGKGVLETRAYVYTWVSAYGEEGPPSPPTVFQGWSEDPWVIRVFAPTSPQSTDRNLSKVRIYRTVTAAGGSTTYFYVAEQDINQTVYVDTALSSNVASNNILASDLYDPPPDDLEGFVAMPNGVFAGWRANEVLFCEPYLPHAWPSSYALNTEFPVVGLGVIGQTLIVCTTGSPYAVSGVNPANMAMSKIAAIEPCLSRSSIVSTSQGVAYASPNGIVLAVPGAATVITRPIVSKEIWLDTTQNVDVTSLRAALLNGGYYAWGSVKPGSFQADTFQTDAFVQEDFSGGYKGFFVDTTSPRVSWTRLSSEAPIYNCWADQWTGEIFTIRNGEVWWLDLDSARPYQKYTWRSKVFESPNRRSLEAMRVWFDDVGVITGPFVTGLWDDSLFWDDNFVWEDDPTTGYGIVRVYADGILRLSRVLRYSGEFIRLPSGFKAQTWEFEIEAVVKIYSIEFANTAKELAGA